MGHTPGPWRATINSRYIVASTEAGGYSIARMDDLEAPFVVREQNARLIAAAPDLLEALRAIVFQTAQGSVLDRDACITAARAAIAKAEASNNSASFGD